MDEKQSQKELPYFAYQNSLPKLAPQFIQIRNDAMVKLNKNTVYKDLVLNKEID